MGRPNPHRGKSRAQLFGEMTESKRRVLEYKLAHRDATNAQIAAALGLSFSQVSHILTSPDIRGTLGAMTAEIVVASTATAIKLLREGMYKAAKRLNDILDDPDSTAIEVVAAARCVFSVLSDMGELERITDPSEKLISEMTPDERDQEGRRLQAEIARLEAATAGAAADERALDAASGATN
jgi:hypothetical protein